MWGSNFHVYVAGRNLKSRNCNLLKVGYMGFCLGLQKNEPKIRGCLTSVTEKSNPWTGPEFSGRLRLPDFRQSGREFGKVVSPTNWLLLYPRKYCWYLFLFEAESTSGYNATRRFMSMKNSDDSIGNQTCNLPACGTMPQLTAPACALSYISILVYLLSVVLRKESVPLFTFG